MPCYMFTVTCQLSVFGLLSGCVLASGGGGGWHNWRVLWVCCGVGSCTGRASPQPMGRAGPGFYDVLRARPGAGLKLAGPSRARAGK